MISALVGAALLAFGAVIVMKGFQQFSAGKLGLVRRLHGDEALVAAAFGVQQLDFTDILSQCRSRAILNTAAPRASVCVIGGAFNAALGSPTGPVYPWTLEVLRDQNGQPSPTGTQCEELLWCRHLASGRILEVTVQAHWREPTGQQDITQRRLVFRRTRW